MIGNRTGFLLALALGSTFGLHRIIDPDVFLQVAVGRAIVSRPSSLGVSTFIDAYPNYHYVEDKWLPSVIVALADAAAGSDALIVYQIALCVLAAGAWYYMQRAWAASPAASLVGVSLALLACNFRLEPRPDTMSHALLAVTIAIIAADLPYRRLLCITPMLFCFWVNVHGYFVNGLLVLLAAAAGTALRDRRYLATRGTSYEVSTSGRLALFGLGLAACLLHPQGWRALVSPVRQILELGQDPVLKTAIAEFSSSTQLFRNLGLLRWILLAASAGGAIATGFAPAARSVFVRQLLAAAAAAPWLLWPPPGLASVSYGLIVALFLMALFEVPACIRERRFIGPILLLGFTILAVPIVRNVTLLPPATLILLAPAWTRAAVEVGRRYPLRTGRTLALTGLLAVVFVTGWLRLSDRLSTEVRAPSRTGFGIDTDRFPAAAADFIEREQLPSPLLNNFDIGGYLLYRFHPRRRVFIAGNTSMYPAHFLDYYRMKVTGAQVDPEELYNRHGVRTVIVDLPSEATDRLVATLSAPSWALVFLDRAGAVFLHVDDTTRQLVERLRINIDERVAELAQADTSDPAIPEWLGGKRLQYPSFNLGLFLIAVGRADLAAREASRLWDRTPSEQLAIVGGQAAFRSGQLAEDVPRLEDALKRYPDSAAIKNLVVLGLAFRADAELERMAVGEAKRDLQRMLTLTPEVCGPYAGLAKAAVLEGDNQKARNLVAEAARRDGSGDCRQRAALDPLLAPLLEGN